MKFITINSLNFSPQFDVLFMIFLNQNSTCLEKQEKIGSFKSQNTGIEEVQTNKKAYYLNKKNENKA